MKTPDVSEKKFTVHAARFSGRGCADVMPFCRFVGTDAEPFTNSAHASKLLTLVPLGAPLLLSVIMSPMPLPSHVMTSCESSRRLALWTIETQDQDGSSI